MSTQSKSPRPFIYGRPVRPDEFLGREAELRTIFNRLRHGESTAIVGEPHIGKSSLLVKLADQETQRDYLGDDAQCLTISSLDLHSIGNDYVPKAFWEEALEPLRERPGPRATAELSKKAAQTDYSRGSLGQLFTSLGGQGRRLVLLLDEFERIVIHPSFQDPAFFALLRSLATRTGGLAVVTASRMSVAEMNERGRGLLDTGSPFFNNAIEVQLRPFDESTVETLLGWAGDVFSPDDHRFIRRVAGSHPFLLQAMAAALVETESYERYTRAAECFYGWVSPHFDDLWHTLDDHSRTTAVILSLVELQGQVLGQDFSFGEIERVDAFGPQLRNLARRGLAEQVSKGTRFDWQHLLLWRGERWTIGTQAFAWWVRDVVIARTRVVPSYDEWLKNKRYRLLLTQEQWDQLTGAMRNAPKWAVQGVSGLARTLFEELTRRRLG
jgi:AAA-like domain